MVQKPQPPYPRKKPARAEKLVRRFFRLDNPGDLTWRTYFWTALAGGSFCGSSFVLLVLIVRLLGEEGPYWGGVFSIALAVSQQLSTIGLFQMRTFQVSDTDECFKFGDYFSSKCITVLLMIVTGIGWILVGGLERDKAAGLLLLLVLRAGESFSDVVDGRYQQCGRLDIASKGFFFKTLLPMIVFGVVLWFSRDMLSAMVAMGLLYWVLFGATDGILIRSFARLDIKLDLKAQSRLILACLPLALNAFLLIYVNNMSKYAVNRYLEESQMTEYNALFMLSFLISLLSSFVLHPALVQLSRSHKEGDRSGFHAQIRRQFFWVAAFTAPILLFAYGWGCPILSLIYGVDMHAHRNALCALVGGGAFLSVYFIIQAALIIMRRQMVCMTGILAVLVPGWLITNSAVKNRGIAGGAYSFLVTTLLLAVVFIVAMAWYTRHDFRRVTNETRTGNNGNSAGSNQA